MCANACSWPLHNALGAGRGEQGKGKPRGVSAKIGRVEDHVQLEALEARCLLYRHQPTAGALLLRLQAQATTPCSRQPAGRRARATHAPGAAPKVHVFELFEHRAEAARGHDVARVDEAVQHLGGVLEELLFGGW